VIWKLISIAFGDDWLRACRHFRESNFPRFIPEDPRRSDRHVARTAGRKHPASSERRHSVPDIDRLYPIREAFALVGLRLPRSYQEIAAGRLKIVRSGRRTFIRVGEIQRYIDTLSAGRPDDQFA